MSSFKMADLVFVLPVFKALNESKVESINPKKISEDIYTLSKTKAVATVNFDDAVNKVLNSFDSRSVVVTIGAGDVFNVSYLLKKRLIQENASKVL